MSRNLLQLVQDIGVLLGADEIDSLDETQETVDILAILRMTFDDVMSRRDWEFNKHQPRTLSGREVGDTQINRLVVPTDIVQLSECVVRYRTPKDGRNEIFSDLTYLSPLEFLKHVQQGNENDSNIDVVSNPYGVPMLIRNDVNPTKFTSFDENHIWFDAYDSTRGTGNLAADAIILGEVLPSVDWTDPTATLPVPERVELLIFNDAVRMASINLRQQDNPDAALKSRRQFNRLRESEARVNRDVQEINYGRKRNRNSW